MVEAGQGVGARDSLISTTAPVLRHCEVIKARASAANLLHLGGPQVNLRQQQQEEEEETEYEQYYSLHYCYYWNNWLKSSHLTLYNIS